MQSSHLPGTGTSSELFCLVPSVLGTIYVYIGGSVYSLCWVNSMRGSERKIGDKENNI